MDEEEGGILLKKKYMGEAIICVKHGSLAALNIPSTFTLELMMERIAVLFGGEGGKGKKDGQTVKRAVKLFLGISKFETTTTYSFRSNKISIARTTLVFPYMYNAT